MRSLPILLAVALLAGCRSSTTLTVQKPPAVPLPGVARLAVMQFSGDGGPAAAAGLRDTLLASRRFDVLDPTAGAVVPAGHVPGVAADAVVMGDVTAYRCEDFVLERTHTHRVVTGDVLVDCHGHLRPVLADVPVTHQNLQREAYVALAVRVVGVPDNRVLTTFTVDRAYRGGAGAMSREQVLDDLMRQCVAEAGREIAPYEQLLEVDFAYGGWKVRRGIELAEAGLWDEAADAWDGVLLDSPANDAAWYNIGLHHERAGRLEQAERMYATAVEHGSASSYRDALVRIRRRIEQRPLMEPPPAQRPLLVAPVSG